MPEGAASECGGIRRTRSETHRGKRKKRMVSRSTPAPSVREQRSQKRRKPAFCGGIFFKKCKQIRLLRQFNSSNCVFWLFLPIFAIPAPQFQHQRKGVRSAR